VFKCIEEGNKVDATDYRSQMNQNNEYEENEEEKITTNSFLSKVEQVTCSLIRKFQARCQKKSKSLALRGHTFHYLEESTCSNFFIGNCKASTTDRIVNFAIRSRTNSSTTGIIFFKARRIRNDSYLICFRR
jgi:hypothetical protein